MCKVHIPQEDANRILSVGQKVRFEGKEAVIESIRVWHDLGTLLGPPHRAVPVFDLQGEGWGAGNIKLDELELWAAIPELPRAIKGV